MVCELEVCLTQITFILDFHNRFLPGNDVRDMQSTSVTSAICLCKASGLVGPDHSL